MMGDKFSKIVIFVAGVAIGAGATWMALDKKYAKRANDEIESVKRIFSYKKADEDPDEGISEGLDKPDEKVVEAVKDYCKIVEDSGYTTNEEKGGEDVIKKPYVIPPDRYGEFEDYEVVSLNYYADGVLTDDYDNVIEDVEDAIGKESLTHFGEYEDDCIFVRNERLETDYEILIDERSYTEVVGGSPEVVD